MTSQWLLQRQEISTVMGERPAELLRALAVLGEPPGPEHAVIAKALGLPDVPDNASYSDVFLFQLYPYASVYLGEEGMMGGDAADRIGGFWSALGQVPPKEPDHLSALLALYCDLIAPSSETDPAQEALRAQAASALLHEHLMPWVFPYLTRLRELVGGFYGHWAELLAEVLENEHSAQAEATDLPVHLKSAKELSDPRDSEAADFLAGLLAPARSGVIVTRADLGRMAKELDLGLRAGERRYALEHLLGAEPKLVLGWLATEAKRQADLHRAREPILGAIADFMAGRASRTAELCVALAEESEASDTSADREPLATAGLSDS
jgi:hypothetical protein